MPSTRGDKAIEGPFEPLTRYAPHMKLPGMTREAQSRLGSARVLVVGLRSSGAEAASYLAAAGIGTLGLMDPGTVKLSELCVQAVYKSKEVRMQRVKAVRSRVLDLNKRARVEEHRARLTAHNAEEILKRYDVIVDGLDDWQTKLLASDVCMSLAKPLIHAGLSGFAWQQYNMLPGKSACLRCVFSKLGLEDFAADDAEAVDFGPMAGMVGAFQAAEAVKLLARLGGSHGSELIKFDGLRREFYSLQGLTPSPDCPDCGRRANA